LSFFFVFFDPFQKFKQYKKPPKRVACLNGASHAGMQRESQQDDIKAQPLGPGDELGRGSGSWQAGFQVMKNSNSM
jgi:hypothetical protein